MPPLDDTGAGRYWLRMLIWMLVASAFVVVIFNGVTWLTPWHDALRELGVALVFATCIVPIAGLAMPRVMPVVRRRFVFPVDWAVLVLFMMAIALCGSVMAIGLLTFIGYVPRSQFGGWVAGSVRISVIMTLLFGIAASAFEALRAQLHETTLALRTKERDEAEARRAAAEAQLASLEARVNPHFLFNTLNSIAELTHRDPPAAERMTSQLASLMRSSLDGASSPLVSVEEELRLVRDYLEIERVRFGERLRFTIDVDEAAKQTPVPRLSLQTVVENSVKYAIASRTEGGRLAIRAITANGTTRLEVEDDGPGFDPNRIAEGHGLALLKSRLAMLFGNRATIEIDGRAGHACVRIEVPHDVERPRA